ncbi:MAG: KEOPS complex kinase/ATPase Bud32 [Candidatus Nanohaloarchaea archaeon]
MKKIRGAEAVVEIREEEVVKERRSKNYRHPELDERLKDERTEIELKLIKEAGKYGVNVPDVQEKDGKIKMEKVEGTPLKKGLEDEVSVMERMGRNVARLHSADIIHGDLTTSNALHDGGTVSIVDFGLSFRSERLEDRAVDIHLLKQVLESSHPEISEEAWEKFVEGYRELEESGDVLEQLKEVEQRGRYK